MSLEVSFKLVSVTDANLIWILENVLLVAAENLTIKDRASGRIIAPSNNCVVPGDYDISCDGKTSRQEESFRTEVGRRDGRCVISGTINLLAQSDWWTGFEAAHIFPLEKEGLWVEYNFGRWITNMDHTTDVSKLNPVQNGLLMTSNLHNCFDQYAFSINPDGGYKIIAFLPDTFKIDGRVLEPICRDPNDQNHVADELLRWHFRQSVLANMRGAGEPIFESDFPPGTDQIATLRNEPYGKERLEMEVELRLGPRAREEESTY
ncbi:uncharacterized protein N7518_000435 [Penicillium psychrosexuale]|uniref:uncharacterized protein n=1 Tax=Penicillium psychrosexuale TaxID=1002107 RepID=UPI002545B1CB|nr:uncharacterized protein N7518_000435 [Penicillium psychrosexuale]KAJ5804132.1 hypothetical protein N7518_000435 [Penicillium psychrosexuale]